MEWMRCIWNRDAFMGTAITLILTLLLTNICINQVTNTKVQVYYITCYRPIDCILFIKELGQNRALQSYLFHI